MKKLANKNKKFPTIKRKTFNENNEIPSLPLSTIIHNKFKIIEKLGQGSFGQVYLVEKINKPQIFAVKVEFLKTLKNSSLLEKEAAILEKLENEDGFPKLHSLFKKEDKYFMVMSLLGDDLSALLSKCGGKFSLRTTLIIGYQIIQRLEALHNLGYVHRDLKPENIAIGHAKSSKKSLFLLDFGLSKEYKDQNNEHIPISVRKGLVGTARYTSINSHLGIEFSRRDDLESLFYVLVYLVDGRLPWQKVYGRSKLEKYEEILHLKNTTHPFIICRSFSREIGRCLEYVKNLQYEEEPNYTFLKIIFEGEMKKKGWNLDDELDWEEKESHKKMGIRPQGNGKEDKELQKFNTCPFENDKINLLNDKENSQAQKSFGTSKAVNVSNWDLPEEENEEGTINKFYQKENINPKFMKFSKKNESSDETDSKNDKIDCNMQELPKN